MNRTCAPPVTFTHTCTLAGAALLRERVGALVHPVAFMRADVPEAHVDALASQARKGALVLVHQRAVALM